MDQLQRFHSNRPASLSRTRSPGQAEDLVLAGSGTRDACFRVLGSADMRDSPETVPGR